MRRPECWMKQYSSHTFFFYIQLSSGNWEAQILIQMKKTKLFGWAFLASMMSLSACSNDAEEVLAQESEIKLTSEITPSRVTSLDYQSTQIVSGQQVGVTITDAKTKHENVAWNVGADGVLTNTGDDIYYGNETATITAYHPYNSAWTGTSHTFSVKTDQSVDANYLKSDLLWATASSSKTENAVPLTFSHKLAKVNVTLVPEYEGTDLSDATISICNTRITTTFSPTNGDISAESGVAQEIKAGVTTASAYTASAIVVPQTVAAGTKFIKVVIGDKTFYYTLDDKKELKSGYSHNYTLTVKEKALEIATQSDKITNWEDEDNIGDAVENDKRLFTYETIAVEPEQNSDDVYLIESASNLKWFMENCKEITYQNANYKLNTDIIFDNVAWEPIYFYGVFDGGNHIIENLEPEGYSLGRYGFFSALNGTVKNLIFKNPSITQTGDDDYYGIISGVLAAEAAGTIINCGVIGGSISVSSTSRARTTGGGLIGEISSDNTIIKGCFVIDTQLKGSFVRNGARVGALIGSIGKTMGEYVENISITSCYTKDVVVSGNEGCNIGTFIGSTYYLTTYETSSYITTCFYDDSDDAIGENHKTYAFTTNVFEALNETNFASAITKMNSNLTDCDYIFGEDVFFVKRQ